MKPIPGEYYLITHNGVAVVKITKTVNQNDYLDLWYGELVRVIKDGGQYKKIVGGKYSQYVKDFPKMIAGKHKYMNLKKITLEEHPEYFL